MPIGYHISTHLLDGRVLASSVVDFRRVARSVLRTARTFQLLAFRLADTHLHLLVVEDRKQSGELVRRVKISLCRRLGLKVGFAPAHYEHVTRQSHLSNSFDYIMTQERHHGTNRDPLFEASNLPDLLGMRVLGSHTRNTVRRFLPRVDRDRLLGFFGLRNLQEERQATVEQVVRAAAAASALPDLRRHSRETNEARRAVLQILGGAQNMGLLAEALAVSASTIKRLRRRPADDELVSAVRLQLFARRVLGESELDG